MVVLIDTNVVLDYLIERKDFFASAQKVMELCALGNVQGYIAFHSIPNIWFILRKKPDDQRREMLKGICTVLSVIGASHEDVVKAIEASDFKDFEDCLQDKCAVTINADYIITRNIDDFKHAQSKVMTPSDFCELMKN